MTAYVKAQENDLVKHGKDGRMTRYELVEDLWASLSGGRLPQTRSVISPQLIHK